MPSVPFNCVILAENRTVCLADLVRRSSSMVNPGQDGFDCIWAFPLDPAVTTLVSG